MKRGLQLSTEYSHARTEATCQDTLDFCLRAKMSSPNPMKESVAKYTRQNSNNIKLEMERPMLQKQVSFVQMPDRPALQRQVSLREPHRLLRQISKNTSMMMKCVVIVSLLLNVLTIPALAAVVVLLCQTCPNSAPPGAPDLMCYPCGSEGIPGVPGAEKTKNGYCCASKWDRDLKGLIDRNIIPAAAPLVQSKRACAQEDDDHSDPKNRPRGKKYRPKTVAHLLVKVSATKAAERLQWMSDSSEGRAFLQGGLEIHNHTIKVRKGGIYRIQSHFSFDSISNRGLKKDQLFDHSIYKLGVDRKITALKVEKTMLGQHKYVSSDVDLSAKLREGEEIGVDLQTFKYLYELDIANTLDIEKIE